MVTNTSIANKLAKDPLAQNGKDSKPGAEQKTDSAKPAEQTPIQKPEEQKQLPTIVPQEKPALPSIQARLKKLDSLNQLLERRKLLSDALDDVNSFVLAANASAQIKFCDSKNLTFSVSNHEVIKDMVLLAQKRLESEIEKVDAQLIFFF